MQMERARILFRYIQSVMFSATMDKEWNGLNLSADLLHHATACTWCQNRGLHPEGPVYLRTFLLSLYFMAIILVFTAKE